jgi:hypothetical protein
VEKAISITASFETRSFYEASLRLPNDIEFSGERKRVRCNELLGALWLAERKPECRERDGQAER